MERHTPQVERIPTPPPTCLVVIVWIHNGGTQITPSDGDGDLVMQIKLL